MRFASAIVVLFVLASGECFAQAISTAPHIAYATANLNVRAAPNAESAKRGTIAKGASVTVKPCANGWCEIAEQESQGFVAEQYLTTTKPAQVVEPTGKGYANSQGAHVSSPARTSDGAPPLGATAQCGDGTYSFSQSRRGTCSHHGGVARWIGAFASDRDDLSILRKAA
jgi:uncharacterized protein YraI